MLNTFGPILPGLRNTTTVVITYPSDRRPWTTELTTSRGHDVFYQSQCSANWYGRDWEERSHAHQRTTSSTLFEALQSHNTRHL